MQKDRAPRNYSPVEQNIILINKIYQSFEALEETLGMLKLEEPLFMTYAAKKSFAGLVFKDIRKENEPQKTFKN